MGFLDNDFEKNFNRGFKAVVFLQILFVIVIVVAIIAVITNPQAVGEFFGKIVQGFNATAK
jgi:hypothetical protein